MNARWRAGLASGRLRICVEAVALIVCFTGLASGQRAIGGAVGAAFPIGGSADALEIGQQSGVFLLFTPRRGPFARARIDFTWAEMQNRLAPDVRDRFYWTALGVVFAARVPGSSGAGAGMDVATKPEPSGYVILGAGVYHQKRPDARRDAAGINTGAGIEFALGPFGAFAEARLHYLDDGLRTKLFPIGLGLRF